MIRLNRLAEQILSAKNLIDSGKTWYHGRPVMITVNDYNLKLFNGDTGITFTDNDGNLKVFFAVADGGIRAVSPQRMPAHETVYAMTVHKSQGSEFDQVLMILPDHDSGILTRELLYTGITRARKKAAVWALPDIFVTATSRRIERKSGLKQELWPESDIKP